MSEFCNSVHAEFCAEFANMRKKLAVVHTINQAAQKL